MADLEVIYDPAKELAAIVDVDNRVGWGPAMIGPHAGEILQAFIDSVPFDLSETDTYTARRHFDSFLERANLAPTPGAGPADLPPPQPGGDPVVAGAPLAQAEAAAAGATPPPPAPADTDMGAAASPADQVATAGAESTPAPAPAAPAPATSTQPCPNCNGQGTIVHGDGEQPQTCGMCQGAGSVEIPASA